MNISQMMRSFLGEASGTDSRSMELKVGQIVRGVILQVMENNEVLVQINSVQVRAKLELPLQLGQSAMLQVQPQSNGALVMLKQVEPGAVGLPEDTFKEWAKQLVLPEQKWAVELVKDLRREGVILNREVAQSFQQAASAIPAGGDAEQWMQASAATYKRGLPMTGTTVGAMQQVMFGRSTHELLETLQQQLTSLSSGPDVGIEPRPFSHAASRVQALLAEGLELLRGASAASETPNASGAIAKQAMTAAAPQAQQPVRTDASPGGAAMQLAANDGSVEPVTPQAGRAAANQPNWLGQMMKWMGIDHELQLAKALTAEAQPSQPAASQQSTQSEAAAGKPKVAGLNSAVSPTTPPAQATNQDTAQTAVQAQGKTDDVEDRQHIRLQDSRHNVERAAASILSAISDGIPAADPSSPSQQESLKSALLSLVSADNTPTSIKETAQQLVQQITGQQLMLTPERNSSVLTHVTMFIPLNSPDGKQTASVHIQTRRERKGELDSSNCRLLFNLSMNTLGDTMVDVNVMDKIVSLNLWNDHPGISLLAESSRSEIADSLQQAGYQLLSLRTTPFPKAGKQGMEEVTAAAKGQQLPDMAVFSSNRYKGVDYRI